MTIDKIFEKHPGPWSMSYRNKYWRVCDAGGTEPVVPQDVEDAEIIVPLANAAWEHYKAGTSAEKRERYYVKRAGVGSWTILDREADGKLMAAYWESGWANARAAAEAECARLNGQRYYIEHDKYGHAFIRDSSDGELFPACYYDSPGPAGECARLNEAEAKKRKASNDD